MIAVLLDSAILIDLLRQFPPALVWINRQDTANLGVSSMVWLEVVQGARNAADERRALRLLQRFPSIDLTSTDFEWSKRSLLTHRLRDGVGFVDCLIASPAARLALPLYSPNLKHFRPLLGELAQVSY